MLLSHQHGGELVDYRSMSDALQMMMA